MDESDKEKLANEFKTLLEQYIDDFLHPIYKQSKPLFAVFIKKGKSVLFRNYKDSNQLIKECYVNLYKHRTLIENKDPKFFTDQKIKIFPKVPDDFLKSFREMWTEGHDNELPDDEKNMSWEWFEQFLEVIEDWKGVDNSS